jgi:hypothetical protein
LRQGVAVAIVVLILWIFTAAAGVTMLRAGGSARRLSSESARMAVPAGAVQARIGAIPLTEDGRPPPVPRTRVTTPPGEHPLLEFSHPALAVTGLAFWTMFVFVRYRPLAWIAVAILAVAIALGLGWLARSRLAAGRYARPAWSFPPRLVMLHGVAAACAITLTVLAAVSASHG